MNCRDVRTDIETLPIREWLPDRYASIVRHTHRCPRCRSVMAREASLEARISLLPDPKLPTDFTARVMAGTVRATEHAGREAHAAHPPARSRRESLAWLAALVGMVAGTTGLAYGVLLDRFPGLGDWIAGWDIGAPESLAPIMLGAGILLYLAGFVTPLIAGPEDALGDVER